MSHISREDAMSALSEVMHPAINRNLVDLGIVKDIAIDNDIARVTFAFPFPNIPIKDQLVSSVRAPLEGIGLKMETEITVMDPNELQAFLKMEQDGWKQ